MRALTGLGLLAGLWLLTGCGPNWYGAYDFERFELSSQTGDGASLSHGDVGWIECDDQYDCQLLRRYDLDVQTLELLPIADVTVEYATADQRDEVVWSWGGAVQMQLEVVESSQTRILLEGESVVLQGGPYQYLDTTIELTR